jgi:hypothetical protein
MSTCVAKDHISVYCVGEHPYGALVKTTFNRFLVVGALVSDLYCPGYSPRQPLEKSSNLSRTAARYKVDPAKTAATLRVELSKNVNRNRSETKSVTAH